MHWQQLHPCGLLGMLAWGHYRQSLRTCKIFLSIHHKPTEVVASFSQRLAEDSNPAVATAASKAIDELKRQWEIEEGDSWRFTMNNQMQMEESEDGKDDNDDTDNLSIG